MNEPSTPEAGWQDVLNTARRNFGPTPRSFGWLRRFSLRMPRPRWYRAGESFPALDQIFAQQTELWRSGEIVWGAVLQATDALFERGIDDLPAVVLYSFDPQCERNLLGLAQAAKQVANMAANVNLSDLAARSVSKGIMGTVARSVSEGEPPIPTRRVSEGDKIAEKAKEETRRNGGNSERHREGDNSWESIPSADPQTNFLPIASSLSILNVNEVPTALSPRAKLQAELAAPIRYEIPLALTSMIPMIATTVLVRRLHLPARKLTNGYLPLVVDRGTGTAAILPARYWPREVLADWRRA